MLALDTNYLYLLIIYSHDDNITSDALTRDMHLVESPIGEVARFNRGAPLGVQCVGGLVCGDGWDGSRFVVDHLAHC